MYVCSISQVVMGGIFLAMFIMAIVAISALVHRAAMGGAQEYAVFNLGKVSGLERKYSVLAILGDLWCLF